MGESLDRLLEKYASRTATRSVRIEKGVQGRIQCLTRELVGETNGALIVADTNTWPVAGQEVARAFTDAGEWAESLVLETGQGELKIHPDEKRVAQVEKRLRGGAVGIAVGSGTINDIVKMASFRLDRPYVVVGTAPSMNGWTSAIAAIVEGGLKKTIPARAPVLVAADPGVLGDAPEAMIGAGYADLMAKWVASGDWRLADCLTGSGFDPELEEISKLAITMLNGREEAIAQRNPVAIAELMESLCISGLSMAVAGSSAHISGAEHLFSHYIDMMLHDVAERELHGRQVGIGTLSIASIYERLLSLDFKDLEIDRCIAARPNWEQRRTELEQHFGRLAAVVLPEAKAFHVEEAALRDRLERLVAEWPGLREEVRKAVAPRSEISRRLLAANAPTHFSQIGLDKARTHEILTWSRDIRSRCTILHLAADLGYLSEWTRHAVEAFD